MATPTHTLSKPLGGRVGKAGRVEQADKAGMGAQEPQAETAWRAAVRPVMGGMAARVAEQVLEATVEMAALGGMVGAEALSTFRFHSTANRRPLLLQAELPVVAATLGAQGTPGNPGPGGNPGTGASACGFHGNEGSFLGGGPVAGGFGPGHAGDFGQFGAVGSANVKRRPDPNAGGVGVLGNCPDGFRPNQDEACNTSPILIDAKGEAFHRTARLKRELCSTSRGTGHPIQIAWTSAGSHNAFLSLPGPDGLVHNGKELFGNFTPQPQSAHPNGFLALAEYDKPENGGNKNGMIDDKDTVFSQLRLWIDANHDGVCQPEELHRLQEFGIYSLALNFRESRRKDEFGNLFRYKAQVNPGERRDFLDQTPSGNPWPLGL